MKKRKLLIAVGGNAISPPDKRVTVKRRLKNLEIFARSLKPLLKTHRILLTHGNGSDVGHLMLQQELARRQITVKPLDTLNAMTQGQLGYWIQQAIFNALGKRAVVLGTRVLVDRKDPAFRKPTKQVGSFHRRPVFPGMISVPGKGYRRVVASPKPIDIIEKNIILRLFEAGEIVIAGGGGGIPVCRFGKRLKGVDCVIDKDLLSSRLGSEIGADTLIILTHVDGVYTGFNTRKKRFHAVLKVSDARAFLKRGEFGSGSMKPKIEAAISFVKSGKNREALIGSWRELGSIVEHKRGTQIIP